MKNIIAYSSDFTGNWGFELESSLGNFQMVSWPEMGSTNKSIIKTLAGELMSELSHRIYFGKKFKKTKYASPE